MTWRRLYGAVAPMPMLPEELILIRSLPMLTLLALRATPVEPV